MKRFFSLLLALCMLPMRPVRADTIKWVDFQIPYASLQYAMEQDIATSMEKMIDMLEDDDDVQNVYHNWDE